MDIKESGQLSAAEEYNHWWMTTRFRYLEAALKVGLQKKGLKILEFGCGTAQNLNFLRKDCAWKDQIDVLYGVDPALPDGFQKPEALLGKDLLIKTPESLSGQAFDMAIAMDTLEHIEDESSALREWGGFLKPGALLFITVPAFPSLWSRHDEWLGHHRRYTIRSLKKALEDNQYECLKIHYAFSWLYFPVLLLRKFMTPKHKEQSDLKKHSFVVNQVFKFLGKLEASFQGNPWLGTSVVGVFKKN